ncbi:hypothetical protein C8Q79DRAFT_1105699 [Trametes meyenii]|nr:hypothetical protein C8Q79DRAFT_1105699 [Trametes meyenii]
MICQTDAMAQYRMSLADLDILTWDTARNPYGYSGRPMRLYKEQDVQCKALVRYGGPERLLAYLRKLHKTHLKRKVNNKKPFQHPAEYPIVSDTIATTGVSFSSTTAATYDKHVGRSAKLQEIKDKLAPWHPGGWDLPKRSDREYAMYRALDTLASSYPLRPAVPFPSPPSVDVLCEVLKAAPELPKHWGESVEGLDYVYGNYDTEDSYEWSPEYLCRLYDALRTVKIAHGTDGLASVRWEVYDCSCQRMDDGPHYDWRVAELRWHDEASRWLKKGYLSRDISTYCGSSSQGPESSAA